MGPAVLWRGFLQLVMFGSLVAGAQPNDPVWSVSVEWMVNLIFFAAVWYYRRVPNILLWLVTASSLFLLFHLNPGSLWGPNPVIENLRGIFGFTFGTILYRYHRELPDFSPKKLHQIEIVVFCFAALLIYFYQDYSHEGIDYLFPLVLIPALILLSLYKEGWMCKIFSMPIMTFLGKISYSIYLLHYTLAYAIAYTPWLHDFLGNWRGIFYVVSLFVISTLSYEMIERPGRKLGRFLTSGTP